MEKSIKVVKTIFPWVVVIIGAYVVYDLFHHMAINVPLAGDDWGYAYEGMHGNALSLAFAMYFNWSGRFFAELWGYIMAANKSLWEMVNPWLFTGLTLIGVIGFTKKKQWLFAMVLFIGLMVSVDTRLRMETYAWIMGSTYVTALVGLFIHLWMIKCIVVDRYQYPWIYSLISALCCFFVGLDMENAAVVMVVSNGLTIGYLWFNQDRKTIKYMVLPLFISIGALLILRLSPGALYRLTVDNQAFNDLSLFEKITSNWSNFLYYTFVANPYPLVVLNLLLLVKTIPSLVKKPSKRSIMVTTIALIGLLIASSEMIYNHTGINVLKVFYDVYYTQSSGWVLTIFYCGYTIVLIDYFIHEMDRNTALLSCGLLLLAGIANGVMVISPIFGARSALYTVYLLILLDLTVMDSIESIGLTIPFALIGLALCMQRFPYLKDLYGMIGVRSERRMMEINYYKDHPQIDEIHITRFPLDTVHSVDIEQGDTYHFDTFKKYYGLNPNAIVIFEWDPSDL